MRSAIFALLCAGTASAIGQTPYLLTKAVPGAFPIVEGKTAASIYIDAADWPGVARAAADLQADIARVTGIAPTLAHTAGGNPIIVGTIGKSALVDQLIREKKIDVAGIAGCDRRVQAGQRRRGVLVGAGIAAAGARLGA